MAWHIYVQTAKALAKLCKCTGSTEPSQFACVLNTRARLVVYLFTCKVVRFESLHDKINKMTCAPSKDSDQPGHPPSLMRVFAVRMKKHWALNYRAHCED